MSLTVSAFVPFYKSLYGFAPFQWQIRLLEHVVTTGRWPSVIDAPTGAGKSSVVDVHVFANALYGAGAGARVPRRLATVVNRRALVDSQFDRANDLAKKLQDATHGVLAEAAAAIAPMSLRRRHKDGREHGPLRVVSLRGGQPTDRTWVDDPGAVMIIAATPDMWGSRVMFRGYATSRRARPRDAGLLAIDSVVVVDEAHLSRQLARTAENVSLIAAGTAEPLHPVPTLNVVSSTATQVEAMDDRVSVEAGDFDVDEQLARRMQTPKTLSIRYFPGAGREARSSSRYVDFLTEEALNLRGAVAGEAKPTVLVIANRRLTAAAVADALAKRVGDEHVACWAGRMRPMDLKTMRDDRPGILTTAGHPDTWFLVATQTAEVGVDLDCAAMVTELAPGSALAQRFGRVNRLGERPSATVRVVVPAGELTDAPPYAAKDLEEARGWLDRVGDEGDVCPWRLHESPPPVECDHRLAYSDLWPGDAELLARTTEDLFEEPDLAFWLRDELDDEQAPVSVVLRRLPDDDSAAAALLLQTPVEAQEVFPATLAEARRVVERALAETSAGDRRAPRAFKVDDEVAMVSKPADVRPGDTIIVDHDQRVARHNVLVQDPPSSGPLQPLWMSEVTHVVWPNDTSSWVDGVDLCTELAGVSVDDAQEVFDALIGDNRQDDRRQVRIAPELSDGIDPLPWVVLQRSNTVALDETVRQTWTPSSAGRDPALVFLAQHQRAVADRAARIGDQVTLPSVVIDALRDAGLHHDDGKCSPAFQQMLRSVSRDSVPIPDQDLAKSVGSSSQRVRRVSALRQGWRHEQLSVAYAVAELGTDDHAAVVARLVGTSHGHGRPFFPHGPAGLVEGESHPDGVLAAVNSLYRTGAGWSDVLERTDERYGIWGIAYLEAVLRAADGTVSEEGS